MTGTNHPNQASRDPTKPLKPRLPLALKILFWGLLIWVGTGWLRFAGAIHQRPLILEFLSPAMSGYLILSGLLRGLVGLPGLWGLLRRAVWAPRLIWAAAAFYPAATWFERIVLWKSPLSRANDGFIMLLTILWLALAFWALRPRARQRIFDPHNPPSQQRKSHHHDL